MPWDVAENGSEIPSHIPIVERVQQTEEDVAQSGRVSFEDESSTPSSRRSTATPQVSRSSLPRQLELRHRASSQSSNYYDSPQLQHGDSPSHNHTPVAGGKLYGAYLTPMSPVFSNFSGPPMRALVETARRARGSSDASPILHPMPLRQSLSDEQKQGDAAARSPRGGSPHKATMASATATEHPPVVTVPNLPRRLSRLRVSSATTLMHSTEASLAPAAPAASEPSRMTEPSLLSEQEQRELEEDEREAWRLTQLELANMRAEVAPVLAEKTYRTSFAKASPTAQALVSKEKLSPIISRSGSLAASDRSATDNSPEAAQPPPQHAAPGSEPRSNSRRFSSPLRVAAAGTSPGPSQDLDASEA